MPLFSPRFAGLPGFSVAVRLSLVDFLASFYNHPHLAIAQIRCDRDNAIAFGTVTIQVFLAGPNKYLVLVSRHSWDAPIAMRSLFSTTNCTRASFARCHSWAARFAVCCDCMNVPRWL